MDRPSHDIFTLMIEPVKNCNLRCRHCYSDILHPGILPQEILTEFIRKTAAYVKEKQFQRLHIIWHGGEPLMAGINFFKRAGLDFSRFFSGIPYQQFIQTNGILLDDEFCHFFKDQQMELGISLDGPADIHDALRKDINGKGTHGAVLKKITLLEKHKLGFGFTLVVSRLCKGQEKRIYDFFKDLGYPFRANPLIPCFNPAQASEYLLEKGEYGRFMCKLFDEWISTEINRVNVSPLDSYLLGLVQGNSPECQHQVSCMGNHLGIRPDGTLVLCSRFQDNILGNLQHLSIDNIFTSVFSRKLEQRDNLLIPCQSCQYQKICHGGCPHNAAVFLGDMMKKDPFCKDYQMIFHHIRRQMRLHGVINQDCDENLSF